MEERHVQRAEEIVAKIEAEAVRLAHSLFSRAVEIAEDVWAEAESARDEDHADR